MALYHGCLLARSYGASHCMPPWHESIVVDISPRVWKIKGVISSSSQTHDTEMSGYGLQTMIAQRQVSPVSVYCDMMP